jgi:uncharacterized protein YndB with AHSA1/START domain
MTIAPISHRVDVPGNAAAVFDLFTAGLGQWWPIAYTFSGPDFADAKVEPRAGGRWLERDVHGTELSWGEVRTFEPPTRIVVTFAIGADRKPERADEASDVEVRFLAAGDHTTVEIEQRHFERHGNDAAALRAGMNSAQGWPTILAELRREAAARQLLKTRTWQR